MEAESAIDVPRMDWQLRFRSSRLRITHICFELKFHRHLEKYLSPKIADNAYSLLSVIVNEWTENLVSPAIQRSNSFRN